MKRKRTLVCVGLLVIVCFLAKGPCLAQETSGAEKGAKPADTEAVAKWLSSQAIPIKFLEAGHGFDDLKPFKKVLKDVRIVGLGEATHGAREFFQFKHRMVEFLVKEMGFNVVALEASYPACLSINDYVLYGKGDRAKALAGQGFWTWDTNEVSDMIEWLYQYNKTKPEAKRVKLVGFDMQNYNHAMERVESYLKKVAPEDLEKAPAWLPEKLASNEFQQKSAEEKEKLKARLNELTGFLLANQVKFTRLSSAQEFRESLQSARIMAQFIDTFGRPVFDQQNPANGGLARRDLHMAENIEFITNSEGYRSRIIVWAHDSHVSADNFGNKIPSMGRHLRKAFGNGYYALGLTFREGAFQTRNMDQEDKQNKGIVEFRIGPPQEGWVDWYFALPNIKNYAVDFRFSSKPPQIEEWLNTQHMMRAIGSGFSYKWPWWQYVEPTVLKKRFDGMVFIDTTTRAKPNSVS